MANKIVLHIGAAKTGSSAIQTFIRKNIDFLAGQGFAVPDRFLEMSNKITGHHVMHLQELIRGPDPAAIVSTFEALRSQVPDDKTILISAENLSNMGSHARFKDAFEGMEARAILYIRRQDELLMSSWQQWHSKTETDFNAWIIKALRQYGHWDRVIAQWEEVVGEGNVMVRVFERADLVEGDLLRDFLFCLGIDPATTEADFEIGTVNPSYSDVITPLVAGNRDIFRDANDNDFYKMVGELTGNSYVEKKKVSLLSRDQRESIMFYFTDINRRVCQKYFPNRPELFPPIDHSKYIHLDKIEIMERQLKFLTHLIYKMHRSED